MTDGHPDNGGYQRGFSDGAQVGRVGEQLREFATRLGQIEATLAKVDRDIQALNLETARQDQRAKSSEETVKVTADAVERERKTTAIGVEATRVARREDSESGWAPWARALAVLGGVVGLVVVILALYATTRHGK